VMSMSWRIAHCCKNNTHHPHRQPAPAPPVAKPWRAMLACLCTARVLGVAHLLRVLLRTEQSHAGARQCRSPHPGTCHLQSKQTKYFQTAVPVLTLMEASYRDSCPTSARMPAPTDSVLAACQQVFCPVRQPRCAGRPTRTTQPQRRCLLRTWLEAQAQSQVVLMAPDALYVGLVLQPVSKVEGCTPAWRHNATNMSINICCWHMSARLCHAVASASGPCALCLKLS
jgi:hypothetical protein